MIVFLTSDIGASKKENGVRVVSKLNNTNHFIDELQKYIVKGNEFLFIASNPNSYDANDSYARITFESFNLSGFNFTTLNVLDSRNQSNAENLVKNASLVYLAGGDAIREMQFFNELNLSNLLKQYSKIVIGQSAGAINLSVEVYCSPEDESEIQNERYFQGLGLTNINIEPHFKNSPNFGEVKIIEKILLEDSKKKPFVAITDGSYIVDNGSEQIIFGEAYAFKNGNYEQICKNGEKLKFNSKIFKIEQIENHI